MKLQIICENYQHATYIVIPVEPPVGMTPLGLFEKMIKYSLGASLKNNPVI